MSNFTSKELEQALMRCASEPIQQIGHIQPHGVLLVLEPGSDLILLQASANLAQILGLPVESVLGKPLSSLMGDAAAARAGVLIKDVGRLGVSSGEFEIIVDHQSIKYEARGFATGELFVLELVPARDDGGTKHLSELILPMQQALLRAENETDICRYMEMIAAISSELLGFDRVMVYRFDSNWDGEVIAERLAESMPSYLGNRFPASDIPPQARSLYTINLLRLVADVDAVPVPILPALNPQTGMPLDMTHSSLRTLSGIHVEYLRNMGVKASMSISLIQNGKLWGLIACHHMKAMNVSHSLQDAASLVCQMVSARLSSIELQERHYRGIRIGDIIGKLLQSISTDSMDVLMEKLLPDLLGLIEASGVIVMVGGRLFTDGVVPEETDLHVLIEWLRGHATAEVFSCDDLVNRFAPSASFSVSVAGLISTPLSGEMDHCIIWLRQEKLREIRWAGNPEKTIRSDIDGNACLSPRKSFETWTESWRGRSASWTTADAEVALTLSHALMEGLNQKNKLELSEQKKKKADAELLSALSALHARDEELVRKLSLAVNQTPSSIMICDLEGNIEYVNDSFIKTTGYSREEILGKNPRLLSSGKTPGATIDEMWEALQRGDSWRGEFINRRKNGEEYVDLTLASPVRQADQTITHYLGIKEDITERKLAESLLQESERRFHMVADAAPVLIWMSDIDKLCFWFNKVWLNFTGRTMEQEYGYGWAEGVHPDDYGRCVDIYVRNFDLRKPFEMEYRLKRHDGEFRWVYDNGVPRFDTTGVFLGYIGSCIDVTDKRQALEKLQESEERWKFALEGSGDGVWDWDLRTGDIVFSKRWYEIQGFEEGEVGNARDWESLVHPDDLPTVRGALKNYLDGKSSGFSCEHRVRCKNGDYKWILGRGKVVAFDEQGQPLRAVGTHSDLTVYRELEWVLKQNEEDLRAIFSQSPDGIIVFDKENRISHCNAAFIQLTELSHEEIIGLSENDFDRVMQRLCGDGSRYPATSETIPAGSSMASIDAKKKPGRRSTDRRDEVEIYSPDHRVLLRSTIDFNQQRLSKVMYFRDITAEARVEQMKTEFLSTAAHELRTPMTIVLGYAELLRHRSIDKNTVSQMLDSIYEQSQSIVNLLNELLDLARIEAQMGKAFNKQMSPLAPVIENLASTFIMHKDHRRVVLRDLPQLPDVLMDREKIIQALKNCLSNAFKFSSHDTDVILEAELVEFEGAPHVAISVRDRGIGMTPEQMSHIFEKFYRADMSGKIPGTGLGMALIKEIIEHHGGRVIVESQMGTGTTVTMLLPVSPGEGNRV